MHNVIQERLRIAADLLDGGLSPEGFARCPGAHHHTKVNGARDFRVTVDRVPTGFCFHGACAEDVAVFNKEFRRRVWMAERGDQQRMPSAWGRVATAPRRNDGAKRPPFEMEKLRRVAETVPVEVTKDWLVTHSPITLQRGMRGVAVDFLEALYQAGEKVLIFTRFTSQGDFGWHVGDKGWRLGDARGIKPVKSNLPLGGPDGVWFLCNPVCGEWRINNSPLGTSGSAKWGRRHGDCVTAWRYLVIENDVAPLDLWLKFLAQLMLPIVAIYTSGGRSVHALVKIDAPSKAHWDATRDAIRAALAPLGADPAAMTGVRLTRLPGCLRGENLQELLWLDPQPVRGTNILRRTHHAHEQRERGDAATAGG